MPKRERHVLTEMPASNDFDHQEGSACQVQRLLICALSLCTGCTRLRAPEQTVRSKQLSLLITNKMFYYNYSKYV